MNKPLLFLILLLLSAGSMFLSENILVTDALIVDHFSQQMSLERIRLILDFKHQWAWVNYVIIPVIYLLKFTLITLWILSGIILFGYKTSFKQIFHIVMVAEFVWLVPSFLTIIWFGIIDTSYTLIDIRYFQPLSLLNFFEGPDLESWIVFPLRALNFFEVFYMIALAAGLRKTLERDFNTSLSFTVPVYGSGLIVWILFITFLTINLSA